MNNIRIQDSDYGPQTEVSNADELEYLLDDIAAKTSPDSPTIIFIYAHGFQVGLGLGSEKSFVHFEKESGEGPYLTTVGDPEAEGVLAFYLFDIHHTEIRQRNLISVKKAREILVEWIQTAERSKDIRWEEI